MRVNGSSIPPPAPVGYAAEWWRAVKPVAFISPLRLFIGQVEGR
jgi:hypothetical protein